MCEAKSCVELRVKVRPVFEIHCFCSCASRGQGRCKCRLVSGAYAAAAGGLILRIRSQVGQQAWLMPSFRFLAGE